MFTARSILVAALVLASAPASHALQDSPDYSACLNHSLFREAIPGAHPTKPIVRYSSPAYINDHGNSVCPSASFVAILPIYGDVMFNLFPRNVEANLDPGEGPIIGALGECTPFGIALFSAIALHEYYHDSCGGHATGGGPDCPGISIAIGTAGGLCDKAQELKDCLNSVECPPMLDEAGNEIPFEDEADVQAQLDAYCARHQSLQDRFNSPEGQSRALDCLNAGYSPTGNCPEIPDLQGGPPPQDWPIEDCDACGGC